MPLARRCVQRRCDLCSCEKMEVCPGRVVRPLIRQFYLSSPRPTVHPMREPGRAHCAGALFAADSAVRFARIRANLHREGAVTGGKSFCSRARPRLRMRAARARVVLLWWIGPGPPGRPVGRCGAGCVFRCARSRCEPRSTSGIMARGRGAGRLRKGRSVSPNRAVRADPSWARSCRLPAECPVFAAWSCDARLDTALVVVPSSLFCRSAVGPQSSPLVSWSLHSRCAVAA